MAELTEVIKTSKPVKTDLEDIKEKDNHSSLDSVIRLTIEQNKRLEAEKELLQSKLEKCNKKKQEETEKVINQCMVLFNQFLESKSPYRDGLFNGACQVASIVLSEEQMKGLIDKISEREQEK